MALEKTNFWYIYLWLGVIYIAGLFVPLMNNDSAHHADIALHMHLTGDYASLIDQGHDYLDKPHLLFWLAALCYKIFGVTTFAYKLPSLLFSMLAIYSTVKLAALFYDRPTARLAGVILATVFAFILANNDVRMDAILTGAIIFSIWQFMCFIRHQRWSHLILGSLGLAMGLSTKGMIGAATPAFAVGIHLLHQRNYGMLFSWKWLCVPVLMLLFASPMLYSYYLQYDLHPEKVIAGTDHHSGLKFILWSQNFERMGGDRFGESNGHDPFFFLHTFLWAFLPWSLLAIIAGGKRIARLFKKQPETITAGTKKPELFTVGTTVWMLVLMSLSGFKLPHYLNILFPLCAIFTAAYLLSPLRASTQKAISITQFIIAALLIVFAALINLWAFPMSLYLFLTIFILIGAACFQQLRNSPDVYTRGLLITIYAALFANVLFNLNYYPSLLQYQAGQHIAQEVRQRKLPLDHIYHLDGAEHSNSFDFYSSYLPTVIPTDALTQQVEPVYVYTGRKGLDSLKQHHISYEQVLEQADYHVSAPRGKFFNPATRHEKLKTHYILKITTPKNPQ